MWFIIVPSVTYLTEEEEEYVQMTNKPNKFIFYRQILLIIDLAEFLNYYGFNRIQIWLLIERGQWLGKTLTEVEQRKGGNVWNSSVILYREGWVEEYSYASQKVFLKQSKMEYSEEVQ